MMGCKGGRQDSAFEYLEGTGSELESAYPYEAKDGTCRAAEHKQMVKVKSYAVVPKTNSA